MKERPAARQTGKRHKRVLPPDPVSLLGLMPRSECVYLDPFRGARRKEVDMGERKSVTS